MERNGAIIARRGEFICHYCSKCYQEKNIGGYTGGGMSCAICKKCFNKEVAKGRTYTPKLRRLRL